MQLILQTANVTADAKNCSYPNKVTVTNACHIEVTYRVNILAVRHSFRTVRCIVRNISLYIQRTELMQQSVAMVPSGSVREGSS